MMRCRLTFFLANLFFLPMSFACYADCDNGNATWEQLFEDALAASESREYEKALVYLSAMETKCSDSPIVHYLIGRMREATGDRSGSVEAYRKATDNIENFSLDAQEVHIIWQARLKSERALMLEHLARVREEKCEQSDERASSAKKTLSATPSDDGKKALPERAYPKNERALVPQNQKSVNVP